MEELFEKLKEKIKGGDSFFDLFAQAIEKMGKYYLTQTTEAQFKHLRTVLANTVESQFYLAFHRAGFSEEEAMEKTEYFMKKIFG